MSNLKYDLPRISGNGDAPLLLDKNAEVYNNLPTGKGYVYVERYAQKKSRYEPLAIGTPSVNRRNTYLIKEQNFRDIGGGLFEWERHYALVPESWYDYQVVSYRYYKFSYFNTTFYLNPNFTGGNTDSTLAKVTREYYLEKDVNDAIEHLEPTSLTNETGLFEDVIGIREDEISVYAGKIYEVKKYEAISINIGVAPQPPEEEEQLPE